MSQQQQLRQRRVGKACERCRLKKSKCDGQNPCSKCCSEDSVCVYAARKKVHRTYRAGYVEMLEEQQQRLVAGLKELHKRLEIVEGLDCHGSTKASFSDAGGASTQEILWNMGIRDETIPHSHEDACSAILNGTCHLSGGQWSRKSSSHESSSPDSVSRRSFALSPPQSESALPGVPPSTPELACTSPEISELLPDESSYPTGCGFDDMEIDSNGMYMLPDFPLFETETIGDSVPTDFMTPRWNGQSYWLT